jgi:hypothetical protein
VDERLIRQALNDRYEAYAPGEWFTVGFIVKGVSSEWLHFSVSSIDDAVQAILDRHGINTYSTMGVFGKEPGPGLKGTAKEITRCAWLWVDLDCHNGQPIDVALEKLQSFKPEPTIIYGSGRGYHAYWAIRPVCIDMPSIRERNIWLANQLKSAQDYKTDSVQNVDRIMRVPGTLNANV